MKNNNSFNFYNRNYIKFRNIILFFNPTDDQFEVAMNIIKKGHRIHIFITSADNAIKYLKDFIDCINKEAKVFIHIPKNVADIKVIVDDIIKDIPNVKSLCEKVGPIFYMDDYSLDLEIRYDKDTIVITVNIDRIVYDKYHYSEGAITTYPMKVKPDLFKDRIIKKFKRICPKGILSSFKDDEDIWNYIMQDEEWINK